jgi:hypothetical protein
MPTPTAPLAVSIVAPRTAEDDLVLLTSAMHALVLDARHPVALEIDECQLECPVDAIILAADNCSLASPPSSLCCWCWAARAR